jgi:hypothetical protein
MEAYCKRYAAYRGTGVTTIDNANGSAPSLVTLLTTHTVPACFAARTVMSMRHGS